MRNIIAPRKDMSDVRIIVCVLCCFSLIECQTVSILQNTTNWFTAFQTCKMLNGRLPGVKITNDQLELQDLNVTNNISSPFWIGATYDFLNINDVWPHYEYKYPYTCCEMIQNVDGTHMIKSTDCLGYHAFLCATSANTISDHHPTNSYLQWHNAFQVCKERNQTLPKRDNAQFLAKVTPQVGTFWLDGIRQIDFKPDIGMPGIQNRNCLHSLIGIIHEGNCYNTSVTTVCIFDNNTSVSELKTHTPTVITGRQSNASYLQTTIREANNTTSTSKSTKSTRFQTITNGNTETSPNINTTLTNLTNMATEEERITGAVIGGVVGSVVVTIIIAVVIIVLVRSNRSNKDNIHQIKHQVIAHNRQNPGIINSSYEISRNGSLEKGITTTTTQADASIDFHTQSQKHKVKEHQHSDHGKAVENTNERAVSVLYSAVQKDLKPNKTRSCGEQVKSSEDNDEEYDKTSHCSKINQSASSGNVYDKADFKHNDYSEYDTTYNINFKHHDNSEYDTTHDIHISVDTTYDHV